jgi:hypothetical protein
MKLRIRGDSLRLRLQRSEVDRAAAGNSIEEITHFPGSELRYRLDVSETANLRADFAGGDLVVTLPASRARIWGASEEVSLTGTQALAGGGVLTILIEKDFSCLSPGHLRDHEDDADSFPHPDAASTA